MEARALATLRRRADCARALMTAERALDRVHPDEPSPWVSPFDHGSLAAEASVCMSSSSSSRPHASTPSRYSRCATPATPAVAHSASFGSPASSSAKARSSTHARWQAALASSDRLSSSRVVALLHTLCAQLTPHSAIAGVDEVVDVLSAALTTRAQTRLLITATGNSVA